MSSLFLHYFTISAPLGYLLVFIGLLFEGEIVLFTAAFLIHQGVFDLGDMLLVVISAVLLGDTMWYFGGSYLHINFPFLNHWLEKLGKPFDDHLKLHSLRTIFVSKFIYGFHRPILLRSGQLQIPFKEFFKADLIASFFWISIIGGLGYGTSTLFIFFKHYFRVAEVALLLGSIIFFYLLHLVSNRSKKIL